MRMKWIILMVALFCVWGGFELVGLVGADAPAVLKVFMFFPAALCFFFFAIDSDWIKP